MQQMMTSISVMMTMITVAAVIPTIRMTGLSSNSSKTLAASWKEMRISLSSIPTVFLARQEYVPRAELDMFLMVKTEKIAVLCPSPDLVCLMLYVSWMPSGMVLPFCLHVTLGVGLPDTWQCRGTCWPGRTACWWGWGRETVGEQVNCVEGKVAQCLAERARGVEQVAWAGTTAFLTSSECSSPSLQSQCQGLPARLSCFSLGRGMKVVQGMEIRELPDRSTRTKLEPRLEKLSL